LFAAPKMPFTISVQNCRRISRVPIAVQVIACAILLSSDRGFAQNLRNEFDCRKPTRSLVIGFVGGFVHSNDLRHSEVQVARDLQSAYGASVQVQVFSNWQRVKAHQTVLGWLSQMAVNKPGLEPRIILFGHSWGASAVVYLARELEQEDIPVALTIQVDSVRRHSEDDSVIPENVSEAVNFYQSKGIIRGCPRIVAANPARTAVLGNFRFKYKKEPAECHAYPWYDRLFFQGHTSIECDPHIWSLVDNLIKTRIASPSRPALTIVLTGKAAVCQF
jgi:hypothetical protein